MPKTIARRALLQGSLAAAGWTLFAPAVAASDGVRRIDGGLLAFDANPAPIVDLHARIPAPVVIEALDVVRHSDRTQFIRARSRDGAEGFFLCNSRFKDVASLFFNIVRPALIGGDARDIAALLDRAYRGAGRGYKYAGLAYYAAVGHAELAVLDLLGKAAGVRVADLLGGPRTEHIDVYLTRLTRDTSPEEEVETLAARVAETGARAVKVKIGGRMSLNADASAGRTDALVPLLRQTLGDAMTIYVDANGSYDAPTAIAIGRRLEDHGVALYEEPCPWEEFEMTRQVADALDVAVGGGEQDTSFPKWRWMIENRGVDIVQPDLVYNGGALRAITVARMAAAGGLKVTPHYPRGGMESAPLMHVIATLPNFGGFMEYRSHEPTFDFDHEPVIAVDAGRVALPLGPGFGIDIDPKVIKRARIITGD